MFLALKEIKYEKLRYGLIIAMIVLVSYLIFILSSLSLGLSKENTAAIESWDMKSIVLNNDADLSLRQSLITKEQAHDLNLGNKQAFLGQAGIVVKGRNHEKVASQFLGIDSNSFLAHDLTLTSGHKPTNKHEIVMDTAFQDQYHYKLGQSVKLNSLTTPYKIVGFTKNAKINIAPAIYGKLSAWSDLKNTNSQFVASAIVSQTKDFNPHVDNLKSYATKKFVDKLPGYAAQNATFEMMIGFLMVISLIVIAVFLYIITIQKLPNYAVLRVQGIPASFLVKATIAQSSILVLSGLIIGALLTTITAFIIPKAVPMAFNLPLLTAVGGGLLVISILGSLIPVKTILKVDPVSVIGG